MTDEDIIDGIRAGGIKHDKAISFLYNSKSHADSIIRYLRSKGISADDANILWTDIVVKFGSLVQNDKYEHQNNMMGYVKNLSGYMMLNYIRDHKKYATTDITDSEYQLGTMDDVTIYHKELTSLFDVELQKLGGDCKAILQLWARGYSMVEIMKELKLISNEATRKRKHICLKKLLSMVENNPSLQNTLRAYYDQE